jgi:hypothetical protein
VRLACVPREFAQGEQFCETLEGANFKPSEPDALALTTKSNPVEAVVPIATSDQRQSMRTGGSARDADNNVQAAYPPCGKQPESSFPSLDLDEFGFEEDGL